MLKLYFQDASSEAAYQASVVTRDRALAAQQQSIDILQRLLAQMGDDPLLVMAKESLSKILANPSVITDEVFNNIMSKTQEVMDANYDAQVDQFLDTARSKGVTGDTLAIQLQKAKNARAQGMAAAYRDALIQRSKEGLTTSIDAINTAFNAVNQSLQNQRVATEDLVNVYQSVVPEPFRNYGPPTAAMASAGAGSGGGGGNGGGSSTPGRITSPFDETFNAPPIDRNVPYTGPTSATGSLTDEEMFGTPQGGPAIPTVDSGPGISEGELDARIQEAQARVAAGLSPYAEGEQGQIDSQLAALQKSIQQTFASNTPVQANLPEQVKQGMQSVLALSPVGLMGKLVGSTLPPSAPSAPGPYSVTAPGNMKTGVAPKTYTVTPQGNYSVVGDANPASKDMVTLTGNGLPSSGVTMGGGQQEAQRVAEMIGQQNKQTGGIISPADIIGTTAGGGVRQPSNTEASLSASLEGLRNGPQATYNERYAAAQKIIKQLQAMKAKNTSAIATTYGNTEVTGYRHA